MILVHRLCELNRCASFVVDKGYLVLIFVVFFRHGEDFVVHNVGVLFDDTIVIRCDAGAFTVNRVVLHCQIGLAGPDILFVRVGRTGRFSFNILIGCLSVLSKRVDFLFLQSLFCAVRNFIYVEFHVGILHGPAEVFLFHGQFEERNIVAGVCVGLVILKTMSEHIECPSIGRRVGRKRRIAFIDSVKSDITCYVIGLRDRIIISFKDHEFRLALLICGLGGVPCIPVLTVRSFVVHLEPGVLKFLEHRCFRKTAVFDDLNLNSLIVGQSVLIVRRSGTVKLIREVLSGFKTLHLNRGIFFIDGVFLSLDLRSFHLVDKVGLTAFAFERNDRSIGAVPVINYFRFGNDCLSVRLQHLERSACELFSGCAVILEDRDAPLKKSICDCNRYICICLGNHYFILAFFRSARLTVNFNLFDEIAFCLIFFQIISPILRQVREHNLGLFDRAVALHSPGGHVLACFCGYLIALAVLQREGEAVISCRNTAKIHLFVNDHPDPGRFGRAVGREDLRLIGHSHSEVERRGYVRIEIFIVVCRLCHDCSVFARIKPFLKRVAVSVRLEALRTVDLLIRCRAPVLPLPGALVKPLKGETDLLGDEQVRTAAAKSFQSFVLELIARLFGIVTEMAKYNGVIISQIIYNRNGRRIVCLIIIPYALCLITESSGTVFKICYRIFCISEAQGAGDKCDLQVVVVQVKFIF